MSERYQGKPFLELVDSYVLDSIGHLNPEQDKALTAREAEFRDLFGEEGNWRQITERRMRFPDGMSQAICEVWTSGRARFVEANGTEPDPLEFTRHFVDTKFPH
ncbi:hypothetical protein [Paraurantiacibacter namhicola]|uniref:Uncharacterized protein n=1 Tax=Paraurantiacibacter namhicola TaxID=645517 RepID=A0A1C7DAB9_9SPHN|nr:hypothetical protein [Paraurantiacibacter namhicola]ANU08375.1 hypothetical protein A6F65_02088 [Paraurantiacibacter namhicola]